MMFAWPLGLPGWKFAARMGLPIGVCIRATHDDEAGVYIATSPQVKGLAVEAASLDELMKEIQAALPVLMQLDHQPVATKQRTLISLQDCHAAA